MSAAKESTLNSLHEAVALYMKAQLEAKDEDGKPLALSGTDVSNILKFLKDNNITCAPDKDNAVGQMQEALAKRQAVVGKDELAMAMADIGHMRGAPN